MIDRIYRRPRIWSNNELKKFSALFHGKIINVSGWNDLDKQGGRYKDYFSNRSSYWITNYLSEKKGFQGNLENEIFLDLESELKEELTGKFDAVFCHTVLEHVFNVGKSFENLCKLSGDIVIVVAPFMQKQHAEYGDYWRFTPSCMQRLFAINGLELIYINYNNNANESIYVFAIGSKKPENWTNIIDNQSNKLKNIESDCIGEKIVRNSRFHNVNLKNIIMNKCAALRNILFRRNGNFDK